MSRPWVVRFWFGNLFLDVDGWFDTYDRTRIAWRGDYLVCGVSTRRFTHWFVAFVFSWFGVLGRPVREP